DLQLRQGRGGLGLDLGEGGEDEDGAREAGAVLGGGQGRLRLEGREALGVEGVAGLLQAAVERQGGAQVELQRQRVEAAPGETFGERQRGERLLLQLPAERLELRGSRAQRLAGDAVGGVGRHELRQAGGSRRRRCGREGRRRERLSEEPCGHAGDRRREPATC